MTNRQEEERRNFRRLLFDAPVSISGPPGTAESRLIDISLKGALVSRPENYPLAPPSQVTLEVTLPDSDIRISMTTVVAHAQQETIGLNCTHIDMESVTHLRRLIELNLGDTDLLDRELSALG